MGQQGLVCILGQCSPYEMYPMVFPGLADAQCSWIYWSQGRTPEEKRMTIVGAQVLSALPVYSLAAIINDSKLQEADFG